MLKSSDEFDRLKRYTFNNDELYVFENYDKIQNIILEQKTGDHFDLEKMKKCYQKIIANENLVKALQRENL
jgi:hypothetical protein